MTYIDAQGRPELLMDPAIVRGDADYRVVPDGDAATEQRRPRTRRPLSPVRAAAAAILRGDAQADS